MIFSFEYFFIPLYHDKGLVGIKRHQKSKLRYAHRSTGPIVTNVTIPDTKHPSLHDRTCRTFPYL